VRIPGTNAHLTYCLNVHPGGTLSEAEAAVFERAPRVFGEFSRLTGVGGPYGLGIWLSAAAASELAVPKAEALARRLAEAGLYALTFNGFPYGRFHGTRVKEKVYRPDWADELRYQYTTALADIMVRLTPESVRGTISTLPVTFRPWADEARLAAAVENLVEAAGYLDVLRDTTGREIALALEPEPGCYLERTDDVLRFFAERLVPTARANLPGDGEATLRRHVGVCLDTVHAAVMGEDPREAVARYAAAGIRVAKVQLGAALRARVGPEGPPEALHAFQDEVYLHQTIVATPDGRELYFNDLPEPLAMDPPPRGEWRVHFHVPLAWEGEGPVSPCHGVDANFLAAALDAGCEHFESEIYTLDIFPAAEHSKEAILARDLAWVWQRLRQKAG